MKPPICSICHARFGPDEGGLVSFARDPEDADWYRRAEKPGFVGHPPHMAWFCGAHKAFFTEREGGTLREALAAYRTANPAE